MLVRQASLLYPLQTIDLAIAQRQGRLKEIETVLGQSDGVNQAKRGLESAEQALAPWQTRVRNLDLEIKSVAQKAQTTEQTLYSGRISNPKEMSDMQNEIGSLKKRQSQLEDELLEAMLHVEESQKSVADAQFSLKSAQAAWAGSQTDLLAEKQRLEAELTKFKTQRQQAAAGIDKDAPAKYEALRPKKSGQAVALINGDSCSVCGVEQTSQVAQQVRMGNQLVYCASCGRILTTS